MNARQNADLMPQEEADAQRARDDPRAVERQVPGRDGVTPDEESALVQVRNRQLRFVCKRKPPSRQDEADGQDGDHQRRKE